MKENEGINTWEEALYADEDIIICYSWRAETEEIPSKIISLIREQRFERIRLYNNPESKWYQDKGIFSLATDAEVCWYLHGASLEAPLDPIWAKLYQLVFSKCFPEKAKEMNLYLSDDDCSGYELGKLDDLKKQIRKDQLARRRERVKDLSSIFGILAIMKKVFEESPKSSKNSIPQMNLDL